MQTDFAALQPHKKRAWGHEAYTEFRDNYWWGKFEGKGDTAIVERITELRTTDKGTTGAMLHLIADLVGGGVTNDNELQGRESQLQSYWQEVNIGRLRKGVRNKGRLSDQSSVIDFRRNGKGKLGPWLAETLDELMFLTASGVPYSLHTDGSPRVTPVGEDDLTTLLFANDVTAPSSGRNYNWTGTALAAGDTTAITSSFTVNYKMIVDIMAEAQTKRLKPLKIGGKTYFVLLMHPKAYAQLKKDADFREAIIHAHGNNASNPVWTGATVTYDGAIIHTHPKVFNTLGAANGSKWGASELVNGSRSLLLGAQALALADLESPQWEEEWFDYKNQQGISIDKMFGILKPRFYSRWDGGTTQDFGVTAINHYIA